MEHAATLAAAAEREEQARRPGDAEDEGAMLMGAGPPDVSANPSLDSQHNVAAAADRVASAGTSPAAATAKEVAKHAGAAVAEIIKGRVLGIDRAVDAGRHGRRLGADVPRVITTILSRRPIVLSTFLSSGYNFISSVVVDRYKLVHRKLRRRVRDDELERARHLVRRPII